MNFKKFIILIIIFAPKDKLKFFTLLLLFIYFIIFLIYFKGKEK